MQRGSFLLEAAFWLCHRICVKFGHRHLSEALSSSLGLSGPLWASLGFSVSLGLSGPLWASLGRSFLLFGVTDETTPWRIARIQPFILSNTKTVAPTICKCTGAAKRAVPSIWLRGDCSQGRTSSRRDGPLPAKVSTSQTGRPEL